MDRFCTFLFCILAGLSRLPAAGQQTPPVPKPTIVADTATTNALPDALVFDLARCQEVARLQNRGLRTALNNFESALAGQRIAESDVFAPKFNLSQRYTDSNDQGEARAELTFLTPLGIEIEPFITENSNSEQEEEWRSNAGITLKRRLFSVHERWRLRLPLSSAERALLQATNTLQRRKRELDFSVMQSFLAVQRVENRLKVRRARVTDAKAFLTATEERVEAELAPKVDIVNATINLNQAEADKLNEETNLRSQTESLLNLLDMNITNDLKIVAYDLESRPEETLALETDSVHVLTSHESLVNAQLDIAFARISTRIQKDLLRPQFDLSVTAEHRSDGANVFNDERDESDPFTLLLSYSTDLDFKKGDKARLRQLQLALENLESSLTDEENRLLLELRAAHRNINRLKIQVGLNQQRLEAERQKLQATIVRYEDGNVDNLEVTRAKQAVDDAEINLINTNIDRVLAEEQYKSLLPPKRPVKTTLTPP